MSDLSIKVNIAGRSYPLTIKREDEEGVRKAAKRVDESVRKFHENYAVSDKQDLLAMTALQLATILESGENSANLDEHAGLKSINELLDDYLS